MANTELLMGIGGLISGGGIGSLFTLRGRNAKNYAESAIALSNAYALLIDKLNEDLARQDRELSEIRSELHSFRDERNALLLKLANTVAEADRHRTKVMTLEAQVQELMQR